MIFILMEHGGVVQKEIQKKEISEANKRVYPLDYLKVLLPTA